MTPRGSAKDNQDGLSTPTPAKWVKPLNTLQCRNIIGKHMEHTKIRELFVKNLSSKLDEKKKTTFVALCVLKIVTLLFLKGFFTEEEALFMVSD